MPALHRYLGNPVLSWLGRHLFGLRGVGDFHCGIRGFSRERIRDLHLCMPGMEFASELVVRASLAGYSIVDVPTTLRRDGRSRAPHLRTWRDGWRHLRFLLVLAPRPTLIWPGAVLATLGAVAAIALTLGPVRVGSIGFDVNALAFAWMALPVGVQLILFGGFAMIYGRFEGLVAERTLARWTRWLRLERCAAVGLTAIAFGVLGAGLALGAWGSGGFGQQDSRAAMRVVLPAVTLIATGTLVVFSGLFGSLLSLRVLSPALIRPPGSGPAATRRTGSPARSALQRRRATGRSAPRR
jgi:hypothetical protein